MSVLACVLWRPICGGGSSNDSGSNLVVESVVCVMRMSIRVRLWRLASALPVVVEVGMI